MLQSLYIICEMAYQPRDKPMTGHGVLTPLGESPNEFSRHLICTAANTILNFIVYGRNCTADQSLWTCHPPPDNITKTLLGSSQIKAKYSPVTVKFSRTSPFIRIIDKQPISKLCRGNGIFVLNNCLNGILIRLDIYVKHIQVIWWMDMW